MKPMGYAPEGWRDESNYPARSTTSMHRWAAEFLIRNAKFQDALQTLRGLVGPKNDPDSPYRRHSREIGDSFGLYPCLITFKGQEPVIYPRFKTTPYHLASWVGLKGAAGKWFLGEDAGWGAALVFDLRKPIAPQIRKASWLLKNTHRGVKPLAGAQRDRRANYQAMLRVLDARALHVCWREIAKIVFPKKTMDSAIDHAKKLSKKAESLRDAGYRDLASFHRVGNVRTPS